MTRQHTVQVLGRRAFLRNGTLLLSAGVLGAARSFADEDAPAAIRFGLVTDLHYADKPRAGSRYYRETLTKLDEAARQFERDKVEMVVELGDLVDAAVSPEQELEYLRQVNDRFSRISPHRHYVLGNHCVDTLTKEEFQGAVGQRESYYSFDQGGLHFIVLDACFRSDGVPYGRKNSQWTDANIPPAELDWLARDVASAAGPIVVLAHQRLDDAGSHQVRNAAEVRTVLEQSGQVVAVFQGHSHQNAYQEIGGIHYCTLAAMIEGGGPENNSYARVDATPDGHLRLTGFRRQQTRDFAIAR
jgi:predicted phosphodiesterase